MFKGFDYGLINEATGEYKILSRSNQTSFLTKYLRSYGGTGKYDNYKIGRVLRNITFSGKGYVDKPANPDSIIFNRDNFVNLPKIKNADKCFSGVSEIVNNTTEVNNMNLETEVAELKDKVQAMTDCASATKEAFAQVVELKDKIVALETELLSKTTELDQSKAVYQELLDQTEAAKKVMQEEMTKKEEDMKKTKADLDSALETVAVYKKQEAEMVKKEKKMKRMASLIEKGLDQETALSAVDQFESLEDSAFDAVAELVASAAKKSAMMVETPKKVKSTEENIAEEALESVEPDTEIDLSAGNDTSTLEDEVNTTRAALVDFVCARLGKKLNKGE